MRTMGRVLLVESDADECPLLVFDDRTEAQYWADLANRGGNRDGIIYDVVPSRGAKP